MKFLIKSWFKKQTVTFQLLFILGITSLIFWHAYLVFEIQSDIRKNLSSFSTSFTSQVQQFIIDNETNLALSDYERIRVSAEHLHFQYPLRSLTIKGKYGVPIYEVTHEIKPISSLISYRYENGKLEFTQDFDMFFVFSIPFTKQNDQDAILEGILTMTPLLNAVLTQVKIRYILGMGFFIFQMFLIILCVRTITQPILALSRWLKGNKKMTFIDAQLARSEEIDYFIKSYNESLKSQLTLQDELIKQEKDASIGKIAAQVAHDIRSPLAALSMTIKDIHDKLPEVERISLRSSIKRIQDIANNLSNMKERKTEGVVREKLSNGMRIELLSSLTENVISEKRTQYRDRQGMSIDEQFDESSYGAFSALDSVEFKRLISNLINNAVEAMEEKGTITISLTATRSDSTIAITDTGKGISKDRLEKVFDRGVSFGKKGGLGLGLAHAKETMEKWAGRISIASEVGKGTTVSLVFKRAESPPWFLPRIIVNPRTKIIILDDDQSIHDIWKARFRHYDLADGEIEMLHFSSASAFSAWYTKQRFPFCRILSDYELLGETTTGLDVIEKYYEGERSILVTSHCEEEEIQKRCEKIGTKLLPKGLAYLVPIEVNLREVYNAIFIGDDNSAQMHWKLSAQEYNKTVRCYSSPDRFLSDIAILDRNIPVYIEEGFLQDTEGKNLRTALLHYGFNHVFLTSVDPTITPSFPWSTDVIDKAPLWLKDA